MVYRLCHSLLGQQQALAAAKVSLQHKVGSELAVQVLLSQLCTPAAASAVNCRCVFWWELSPSPSVSGQAELCAQANSKD